MQRDNTVRLPALPDANAPVDEVQRRESEARETQARETQARESIAEKSVAKLLRLPRRTRDEREFLPAALEIVDTPPSPVGRAIGLTIIAVAVLAIAWACIGQIDIVASASGRIVPQGKTKIVQPADTGIVTAIHVADGDHVKAGDILIELNSIQTLADRDRFLRDLQQANLNLARLHGLAATLPGSASEERTPDLVDPPTDAKPEDLMLALAAMRAQAANENAKLADLDQQVQAKQAEAAEALAASEKLRASLPMVADQEKILRDLRDQKIGSKLEWYQANQALIEQQHEIGVLAHRKNVAEAAQRALREQRTAEAAQYQMSVLADLGKARAQASELEAELAKAEQRLRQGILHAPIAGTVQQLAVHTIGGVVTPAESLLAIVPADASLVVEAAVQNRDVGFIRAGQTVRVKVEAFNFTLYGLIEGEVLDVTRDTVSQPANNNKSNKGGDQNGGGNVASEDNSGPVYLARIALSQDWMMTENGRVSLAPGMAVTAEIQTGTRRLISYLLSPLVRRVSESMHER
jgi:hemolysin D